MHADRRGGDELDLAPAGTLSARPQQRCQQSCHGRHVGADQQAERGTDRRTHEADRRRRQEEGAHDGGRRRSHGPQDGNAAALDPDQHGEARHHVHGRYQHDQRQDDEHHHLLDLQRSHEAGVQGLPIRHLEIAAAERLADFIGDPGRSGRVGEVEIDRADGFAVVLEILLQHLQRHEDQGVVELVAFGEEARQHLVVDIARRDAAVFVQPVSDDRDLVARAKVQCLA